MSLTETAIRRPVFTTVIMLALMVMGGLSFKNLGTDLFPNVNFPVVTITTVYPGASPAEVESQVSKKLEDAVSGIEGLDFVRSWSRESMSTVLVVFKLSVDIEQAATDVRERVALFRAQLPSDVREPTIKRVDVSAAPVMVFVAEGSGMTDDRVKDITENQVKPVLERVPGVAAINVVGGKDREVEVLIDRDALDRLGVPLTAVADKLRAENLSMPTGHFDDGPQEVSVRLRGDLAKSSEVGDIVVYTTPKGTQIKLSEIATVKDGFAESRTKIRANGKDGVAFEVQKQAGENTVDVCKRVAARIAELQKGELPKGYSIREIIDTKIFIEENTAQVEEAIVFGGAMAILIIFLFMLDWRSTFISALALPTSVIGTFWMLDLLGYTLNMMTLMGLSLAIGLLIDDAVVVRENIYRHLEMGKEPKVAALEGTREIALAVMATTFTVVAVFIPVAFMKGVVGQFFKQFGFTMSAAVLLSLFVAFTLDPMLSAKLAVKVEHGRKRFVLIRFAEWVHQLIEDTYMVILRFATRFRLVTVLLAVGTYMGSLELVKLMGSDFVAPEDRAQFMVTIELPPGTSLTETGRRLLPAETKLLANPNITVLYSKLGPNTEVNKAQWRVVAVPKNERKQTQAQIQDETREVLKSVLPDAKVAVTPPAFVEGMEEGPPLQIQIRGTDTVRLEKNALAIEKMVRSVSGVGDIKLDYAPGRPEHLLEVDRKKAAELGVPVLVVARTLRAALEGEEVGKLRQEQGSSREVKIRVRLEEPDRTSVEKLGRVLVPTARGPVPLRDLVTTAPAAGPQVIDRQDRTRQIVVSAVPTTRSLGEILKDIEPQLEAFDWGPGGYYRLEGQVKQMRETFDALGLALGLAVLFIFLILAAQFESFIHPLTIMLSLPLAFVGAFVALFLTDNSLSMGSNIGIILLMGLVTKNAILLVDAALENQRHGLEPREAVLDAGRRRLRPILMTSAAMILGMLPTALSNGPGSEFRSPMALAVIGGVVTSTLLTLVVVPAVFLWFDKLRRLPGGIGRFFRRLFGRRAKPAPVSEPVLPAEPALPADPAAATQILPTALVVLFALCVGWAAPAGAAEPLTLDQATARALEKSPDLVAMRARLAEADMQRKRVLTAWLPDVKLIGSYTHNSDEASFDTSSFVTGFLGLLPQQIKDLVKIDPSQLPPPTIIQKKDTFGAVLTLDQTLFAYAPIALMKATKLGLTAQEQGQDVVRREIAYRVAEVFYAVSGLDRLIAAAKRAAWLADERIKQADLKREAGGDNALSLVRAKLERTRADQDLLRAEQGRRQLLSVLGVLLDDAPPEVLVPPPTLDAPSDSLDALFTRAVAERADLTARRAGLAAQKALVHEAEWRWLPLLTANAWARYSDTAGFTGENWSWAITLNLVVPLFDRGTRYADMSERRARLTVMEADIATEEHRIRAGVRQAALEVDNAKAALVTAEAQTRLAKETKDIVDKARAAGALTSLEVSEADANVRMAEENEANLRMRLELAVLGLRHATGMVRAR